IGPFLLPATLGRPGRLGLVRHDIPPVLWRCSILPHQLAVPGSGWGAGSPPMKKASHAGGLRSFHLCLPALPCASQAAIASRKEEANKDDDDEAVGPARVVHGRVALREELHCALGHIVQGYRRRVNPDLYATVGIQRLRPPLAGGPRGAGRGPRWWATAGERPRD